MRKEVWKKDFYVPYTRITGGKGNGSASHKYKKTEAVDFVTGSWGWNLCSAHVPVLSILLLKSNKPEAPITKISAPASSII